METLVLTEKRENEMLGFDCNISKNLILDYGSKLVIALWAWISPIWPALAGIILLCGVDFILGVMRSNKLNIRWSSTRARLTINKIVAYILFIFSFYLLQTNFASGIGIDIYKFAVFFAALIEIKSIVENSSVILGFNPVSLFKLILNKATINKEDLKLMDEGLDTKPNKKRTKKS